MAHRDTMSCLFVCTIASPLPKQSLITRTPQGHSQPKAPAVRRA